MTKELEDAIRLIEEAGGIVMMQGDLTDHEQPLTERQLIDMEAEEQAKLTAWQRSRDEDRNEAFSEMTKQLNKGKLTYSMAENICFENGMDADEIENWIHSHY